jgi:hypothetical protein
MAQRLADPRLTEFAQIDHRIWARRAMISQIKLGDVDEQWITIVGACPSAVLGLDPPHAIGDECSTFGGARNVDAVEPIKTNERFKPEPANRQVERADKFGVKIGAAALIPELQR